MDITYDMVYEYLKSIDFSFYSIYEFEIVMRVLDRRIPGFTYYKLEDSNDNDYITMRLVFDGNDDIDIKIK